MENKEDKKPTILIVDDEEMICFGLSKIISKNSKYRAIPHCVQKGFNPNKLAEKYAPETHVLVTDLNFNISDCDGIKLAETFKKMPNNRIKGYILQTASEVSKHPNNKIYTGDGKEIPEYMKILTKPVSYKRLLLEIETAMNSLN
ncbi:MAG: hypothetical protein WC755_06560 [Candidatus Woesearchaeota archaeon]|jgi:CheY-like chemotaxis protein